MFFILGTRFGGDIRDPSDAELESALHDIYDEDHPHLTEDDYAEHPDASVRFGDDSGPMFVVTANRKGRIEFFQWADADYEQELAPPGHLKDVPFENALRLWRTARRGEIASLRQEPWLAVS
jgi:hypothetical protein